MRPYYREIHLLHYEPVAGLSFIDESVDYFERKWGVKIHRFPHPEYWRMMRTLIFQPPKRADAILAVADTLPRYDYERLQSYVKADLRLPMQTLCATGVRWADNMQRRLAIKSNGVVSNKRHSSHMVWDWSLEDVRTAIRKDGVKLPSDYTLFGNSWDGIDYRYMAKIRDYYPSDFQLICEHFPLVEAELFRYEKQYGYPRKGTHSMYLKDIVKEQK
ncbi:MAG: phosphoadenosine phosphosulfate reductase [Ignavibacteria bacterium]|nr:phosphoadenosine phosphosulfate reductase [Ignavibacteria bacterium]